MAIAVLALAVPLVAIVVWLVSGTSGSSPAPVPALPAPRDPVLPDLVVSRLGDVLLARKDDGTRSLFFTAAVGNIGSGPFVLGASRRGTGGRWLVTQRFDERGGGRSERVVPADLVFGGHGHDHWHVRFGASYRLRGLDGQGEVRRLVKAGYCFFDQAPYLRRLPGAPRSPRYPSSNCNGIVTTSLEMGLSVGWSDPYTWLLPDQRIDVTDVPEGDYRLIATADPDGWFDESTEANNTAWVDLRIGVRSDGAPVATVLRRSAPPRP